MSVYFLAAVGSLGVGFVLGGVVILAAVERAYSVRRRQQAELQRNLNAAYQRLASRESDDVDPN